MKADYISENPTIQFYNIDCMDFMVEKPDNYYDLAIVDPPYGIGASKMTMGKGSLIDNGVLIKKKWDKQRPEKEYFSEIFRISKKQIIWGGNYFSDLLPPSRCWLIWDKMDYNSDFASSELAYTSFDKVVKTFRHARNSSETRIHPTQKPIQLYRWLLQNYSNKGDKILDTHGGSMSIAIACDMEGFELDICELDKDYFNEAIKRFRKHKRQLKLF